VLDSFTALFGAKPATAPHLATGNRGEEEALFHLRRNGYVMIARRWRTRRLRGDIDLIGWDGGTLCFIEVKTRTSHGLAPAESAVDDEKQRMLRRMAHAYLKRCDDADTLTVRFDVVCVYLIGKSIEFEILKNWFTF
jgi:putative endonuclease